MLVVIEHARSLLFVDYKAVTAPTFFDKIFYFLTGFGHESVVVFFVISGFLVGGKTLELWRQQGFQWKRYLADRASRLYSVLFAALILGGCLDWVGSSFFNTFEFYTNETITSHAMISESFVGRLDFPHFVSSLLMLQEIILPSYGSNGPLWSLAHEWWYYLLFPLTLYTIRGRISARGVAVCCIASLCWFLSVRILVLFGVWMIGVATWRLNRRIASVRICWHRCVSPLWSSCGWKSICFRMLINSWSEQPLDCC